MLAKFTVALNICKVLSSGELVVWTPLSRSGGELLQPPQAAFLLIPTLVSTGFSKVYMFEAREEKWGPGSSYLTSH